MPLPEQPLFENLLQSMTPVCPDPADDYAVEQILPLAPARDEFSHFLEWECFIWYRPCTGLTFDALAARIQKELGGRGHKSERSLARCIIGIFALYHRPSDGAVDTFNRLIGTIGDCDLSQFFVTPLTCD